MAEGSSTVPSGQCATCVVCLAPFQRLGVGRPRKFCSTACRQKLRAPRPYIRVAEPKKRGRKPLDPEEKKRRKAESDRARKERDRVRWREKERIKSAKRRAKYAERLREKARHRYQRNKDKEAARNAKRRSTISGRLRSRISSAVWHALKGSPTGKNRLSILNLLPYSIDDLRRHLERQFKGGMSWKTMGRWHIDHIVPVSSFNISGPDCPEFRACWALTNLRPLWAEENIRKGAKRTLLL